MEGVMAAVVLFDGDRFNGDSLVLQGDDRDLRDNFFGFLQNWNDRASSLIVVDGNVKFYRDVNFTGHSFELGEGFYVLSQLQDLGYQNNSLSSLDFL
jgi:Beta/Gamma crystallin